MAMNAGGVRRVFLTGAATAALGLSLGLAACGERRAETEAESGPQTAEPAPAPADPAPAPQPQETGPLALDLGDANLEASVALPQAASRDPELYARLRAEAEAEAEEARAIAAEDAAFRTDQDFPFHPHTLDIEWTAHFETETLVSLLKTTSVYQGGAHPNLYFDSLAWRLDESRPVEIEELISGQAGWESLSAAAEAGLMAEKRARLGDGLSDEDYWLEDVRHATGPNPENFAIFTLVPAVDDPARAGGLVLHYAPYAVGPYAEGAYIVAIPQSAFAGHVSPDYAEMFGGDPAGN